MSKPSIPKGTRDFQPLILAKRKFILKTIETVYQAYGFMEIQTPSMENLSTLTGKYGSEGDQLLFKIVNSGDYLSGIDTENENSKSLLPKISEKGLRYDLTVPLARYVVMNQNDISFPFKRYQMQPVWRADRPQKNRYREFWQCDADVLGTKSMLCEADFIAIYQEVFKKLGISEFQIKLNHRKLLEATIEKAGQSNNFKEITIIIDKKDKVGEEGVKKELQALGLSDDSISIIFSLLTINSFDADFLNHLKTVFSESSLGMEAIKDLETILSLIGTNNNNVVIDCSLARGLDYYTGCIFEAVPTNVNMGSISGGGRYDNLTAMFGLNGVSGVGISFGLDRIYDLMEELNLFSAQKFNFTNILFCPMDENTIIYCNEIANSLRQKDFNVEVYPSAAKLNKQLDYANKKQIEWVAIVGENEYKSSSVMLKNMETGTQELIEKHDLLIKNLG